MALAGSGAEAVSFLGLANSMVVGSDGLFEPLVAGETNPVLVPCRIPKQTHLEKINKI